LSANTHLHVDHLALKPFARAASQPCVIFFLIHCSISGETMNLRPLADRVIVKRIDSETKTASGIFIPDAAAEKPDQGEVLAVGPGKKNDKGELAAMNVKVGDRVLFGKYSGQTVKVDGDELLVMKEDDLFAVVEGK
jgi:chaperonin GroES